MLESLVGLLVDSGDWPPGRRTARNAANEFGIAAFTAQRAGVAFFAQALPRGGKPALWLFFTANADRRTLCILGVLRHAFLKREKTVALSEMLLRAVDVEKH